MHIKSPAKINLFLHITGKRTDGYHDLLSLMCGVSLYDDIQLAPDSHAGITVKCDHEAVPEDNTNLAYQAADLFFSKLGRRPAVPLSGDTEGLSITIKKKIPVAAGLGGGLVDPVRHSAEGQRLQPHLAGAGQVREEQALAGEQHRLDAADLLHVVG